MPTAIPFEAAAWLGRARETAAPRSIAVGRNGRRDIQPPKMFIAGRSEAFRLFLPRPQVVLLALLLAALVAGAGAPAAHAAEGPSAKARPMVAGQATQGGRLFGAKGSWSGTGKVDYTYQWFRCDQMGAHCQSLRGVTKRSHLLGENDVGHTLGLAVRATDSGGSTTAVSSLIGPIGGAPPVLASTAQPTVSGEVVKGSKLKVDPGKWNPAPKSFSYQWARCSDSGRACAPIEGATAATHVVEQGDLGHALVAIVQARAGAVSQAVFSVATAPVGGSASARPRARADEPVRVTGPSSSAPPVVAFVIQQGRQLTGAVGSWSGSGTIKYAYQWHRCDTAGAHCKSISGATGRTYTLVAKDVGQTVGFGVRATDKTGTRKAYASLVGPVAGPQSQARLNRPADGRRCPRGGSDAPGLGRQLEPDSDHDRVPVAALQREWATVQAASRSHREHLHRDCRRHRARPACRRPRNRGRRIAGRGECRDSLRRRRPGDRPFERRAADSDWDRASKASNSPGRPESGRARA